MKFINYLADLLYRHQKKLEFVAIFLLCLAVGFHFDNSKTTWLWSDYTFVAVILVLAIVLIAIIWIRIEKNKTTNLINEIKQ